MQTFFSEMKYELILMILGLILFIATIIIFILKSIKSDVPKILIAYFTVSIIMIAYPSITMIQWGSFKATIGDRAQKIADGRADSAEIEEFNKDVEEIDEGRRKVADPEFLVKVAKAQVKTGQTEKAKTTLDNALKIKKNYKPAMDLQASLADVWVNKVRVHPANVQLRTGQTVSLCGDVGHKNLKAGQNYKFTLFLDRRQFYTKTMTPGQYGGCKQWVATAGTHTLECVVYPDSAVRESNKNNNRKGISFTVQ